MASIGSYGLLGTEGLQSCLPHQLDLQTGQLWAEGRSTSQLHQHRLTPNVKVFLKTSVVLPPDSEIVAPVSVRSASGVRPVPCSLVGPFRGLTEDYGVAVGCTLVDASLWSASVLMVNPNEEEIVLPSFAFVGDLVPVSAVLVALADPTLPGDRCEALPDHLEDIVMGSHPSLGRLVDCCFGSFTIGRNMCSRRPGSLLPVYYISPARAPDFGRPTGPMWTSPAGPGRSPNGTDMC